MQTSGGVSKAIFTLKVCSGDIVDNPTAEAMRALLLSPERHLQGAWLLNLKSELEKRNSAKVEVDIVAIEHWGQSHFDALEQSPWNVAVNRVSDASEPAVAKMALVIMRQLELRGVPVINPSSAYSLLMSKSGHHAVLRLAGVEMPESTFVNGLGLTANSSQALSLLTQAADKFPLLYKPCAAAYAKGVVTMNDKAELEAFASQVQSFVNSPSALQVGPLGNDHTGFLQKFCAPDLGQYFRVFVLDGKFQCAIKVVPRDESGPGAAGAAGAVTSTCACSADKTASSPLRFFAYTPTEEEAAEAVRILSQVAQADCGSVEFLLIEGKRLYFDVNLLSHLPVRDESSDTFPGFEDPEGLWSNRNFYAELAMLCLSRGRSRQSQPAHPPAQRQTAGTCVVS